MFNPIKNIKGIKKAVVVTGLSLMSFFPFKNAKADVYVVNNIDTTTNSLRWVIGFLGITSPVEEGPMPTYYNGLVVIPVNNADDLTPHINSLNQLITSPDSKIYVVSGQTPSNHIIREMLNIIPSDSTTTYWMSPCGSCVASSPPFSYILPFRQQGVVPLNNISGETVVIDDANTTSLGVKTQEKILYFAVNTLTLDISVFSAAEFGFRCLGYGSSIDEKVELPHRIMLKNYPNPFNSSTNVTYDLLHEINDVTIGVYNILGQKLETLVDKTLEKGTYSTIWRVNSDIPSGIYFIRMDNKYYNSYNKKTEKNVGENTKSNNYSGLESQIIPTTLIK
ncbi:MAG: T9SS type A sorting domain-containing protein [Candidatus Woesearchaeota archaeon]